MNEEIKDIEETSYKDDIKIDIWKLEEEWMYQPSRFQKYARILSNKIHERDRMKQVIEIERAKIEKRIRKEPSDFGLEKATDSAVNAIVNTNKEIRLLNKKLNRLNYEVNRYSGIKAAFEQKKSALEYLTRLYLAGYFADRRTTTEKEFEGKNKEQAQSDILSELDMEMKSKHKEKKNGKR